MEDEMIKTFEEKKEHAQLMRNIFGITAVLFIGFIIWIACIHRYEILWWSFLVWLLLVGLAVSFHSRKKDAELVLKYIEYVNLRHEFIETIINEHTWFSVDDRMPREDTDNKGISVGVIGLLQDGRINKCYYSFENSRWFIPRYIGTVKPTHWMYIPKV